MKPILLILAVLTISLASCEKCATCNEITTETTTYTNTGLPDGRPVSNNRVFSYCGTSSEIKAKEGIEVVSVVIQGNRTITTTRSVDCNGF